MHRERDQVLASYTECGGSSKRTGSKSQWTRLWKPDLFTEIDWNRLNISKQSTTKNLTQCVPPEK